MISTSSYHSMASNVNKIPYHISDDKSANAQHLPFLLIKSMKDTIKS